jgi:calcineurin-like phosphoesterase family protein
MRYFTSDTHFGHERIITLCNRPYSSVEEMNESIIDNWNAVVRPSDIVYHLGDVALGTISASLPLVARLNGRKILVPGNHDRIFSGEKIKQFERFFPEYQKVFAEVLPEQYPSYFGGGRWAMLCHFPYSGDSHGEDRHADKRPVDEGLPLIHGHVHNTNIPGTDIPWRQNGRQFNVGVDVNNYTPVSEDEIAEWIRSL